MTGSIITLVAIVVLIVLAIKSARVIKEIEESRIRTNKLLIKITDKLIKYGKSNTKANGGEQ